MRQRKYPLLGTARGIFANITPKTKRYCGGALVDAGHSERLSVDATASDRANCSNNSLRVIFWDLALASSNAIAVFVRDTFIRSLRSP